MKHFAKMVNLARTEEDREKEKARMEKMMGKPDGMEYPPTCCICLTDEILEKLGIDEMPEKGDEIHLCVMAEVTGISENEMSGRRIELQIVEMQAAENETAESHEMIQAAKAKGRYGDKEAA